ncbi:hypothetical protein BKA57DRAFT_479120 [Linnemannia elongata]|nr:hypothetical protein BKA57DRAFT_479120 [Linnemannia elongata]
MASGKRKGEALASEHPQGSAAKQARMLVGGKSRGPQPAGIETPTTTKARKQTQRQAASKSSEQAEAAATMKHPMVLQLEQANTRILQETMESIRKGGSQMQQALTASLTTQSERTYESLRSTIDLFNTNNANLAYANSGGNGGGNSSNKNNNNRTTAIPLTQASAVSSVAMHLVPALKMVVDEHTEAVTRIATELNQWTVRLMTALVGTSLSSGRTLRVDSLAVILAQQQQQYSSSSRGSGSNGAPPSPVSPITTINSQQQQRQPQFRFDRKATTIRRMLEECQRYKVCKYQDRYLGYDKATQFHSYRAEERYIQARMVVFEEVRMIMEARGVNSNNGGAREEEDAVEWLEREFLKMDGSTARFLEILKERQKLRKSQVRRV